MSTISLGLPTSLHNAARELARKERISINQFIMLAIAEKLSVLGAEEAIHKRSSKATKKKFLSVLKRAPDGEPEEKDRLN